MVGLWVRVHKALEEHVGFTLIEFMVSVAILAILTAMAIPIYTGF